MGRKVVYRDWTCSAKGDGSYFTNQAPGRLGFTVHVGEMEIVRFKTPPASAAGMPAGAEKAWHAAYHIDATTDFAEETFAFISQAPCDFKGALSLGGQSSPAYGGGNTGRTFLVTTSPLVYAGVSASTQKGLPHNWLLQLKPETYYYLHYLSATAADVLKDPTNPPDTCQMLKDIEGKNASSGCGYLAMDGGMPPYTIAGNAYGGKGTLTCYNPDGTTRDMMPW